MSHLGAGKTVIREKRIMKLTISTLITLCVSFLPALQPLPVSAATTIPSHSLLSYAPPAGIYVRFWHLTQSGAKAIPETQCASGHDAFGCVAYSGIGYFYPYNTNPALVSVENDYLLDVVNPRIRSSLVSFCCFNGTGCGSTFICILLEL
jgi:hypothetical protein